MKKHKKIKIILLICVVILIISLILTGIFHKKDKIQNFFKKKFSDNIKDKKESDEIKKQEKIKKEKFEIEENCQTYSEVINKQACLDLDLHYLAQKKLDIDYCYEIQDDFTKNNCLIQVISEKVYKEKDVDLCNKLDKPDECKRDYFLKLAMETRNTSFCESLADFEDRRICNDLLLWDKAVGLKDCSMLKTEKMYLKCIEEINKGAP
jgi:hypothetical protein